MGAYAGGRVWVPVDLNGNGVAALNYTAEWTGGADLETCVPGDAVKAVNARHECVEDAGGSQVTVIVVDAGVQPVQAMPEGHVTHLLLDVPPGTAGSTFDVCIVPGSVAFGDTKGIDLCVTRPDGCGQVEVLAGCNQQGDCNCDGEVNSGDRVCLISKFFEPELRGTCACEDCNLSGELNAADAPCITKCAYTQCPATGVDPES